MAPKQPTRAQLSSKLAYQSQTPSFLLKLQNRINGISDATDEDYDDPEFENDGSGRPPIPRRPAIPERPADDPGGSGDEEDGDEKPQVVVLKSGKHLTEWEAENVRRAEKGLPPLPNPNQIDEKDAASPENPTSSKSKPTEKFGMTFSSASTSSSKHSNHPVGKKRKAMAVLEDMIKDASADRDEQKQKGSSSKKGDKPVKKKAKKESKTLLSFGDDT